MPDSMESLDFLPPSVMSSLVSSLDSIQCPHRAVDCKFLLVGRH